MTDMTTAIPQSALPASDPVSRAIERSGLIRAGECLACDVCCRFPLADSQLAPFFSHREEVEAVEAGLGGHEFLPGRFGAGGWPLLVRAGCAHHCPAFREKSNGCAIYSCRPLDCRLYPFLLMYSAEGDAITLGLDRYCPRALERMREPAVERLADEVAALLEGPLLAEIAARRGIVGCWKEHVEPLKPLPALTRTLCRTDLGLARLVPTARERLAHFFTTAASKLSYHAFASLVVWTDLFDLYWQISGDRLIVIADGEGDAFMLCPPLGTGPLAPAAGEATALLRMLNPCAPSPRVQEAGDAEARELQSAGWRVRESVVEYVYSRSELADLAGNRLASKRQMCNRFEREHDWRFRPYDPDDFSSVMSLYRSWLNARVSRHPDELFTAQAEAGFRTLHRSLRDASDIGLRARVLEAEGRVVGYTGGYPLSDGRTFHVLHEISDLAVRGAAQVLFREFCRDVAPFERINAGGGSCLPQLGRVKESYRPVERIASHTLVPV